MDTKKFTDMNKDAWNEVHEYHMKGRKVNLAEAVKKPDFNVLTEIDLAGINKIGIQGKRIAHICCNNGIELISLMKLGAKKGVGFDISEKFITEATNYAAIAQVNCDFIRINAYDINSQDHGLFDMIFMSIGGLCWLPDLKTYFQLCSSLLKRGGHFLITDSHPYTILIGFEGEEGYVPEYPMNPVNSYFKGDPWIDTDGIDYIGGVTYESKPMASFPHKLGDIFNNLISAGIEIVEFNEYPQDVATIFSHVSDSGKLPLCYSLIGKKRS